MDVNRWKSTTAILVLALALLLVSGCAPEESPIRALTPEPREAPEEVQLVAVQAHVTEEVYRDRATFEQAMREAMEAADRRYDLGRDTLVVFPEDIGLLTILFDKQSSLEGADGLDDGMERVIRENLLRVGYQRIRHRVGWARALFLADQSEMAAAYFETFSRLAREYEAYIVAGSAALSDGVMARYVPAAAPGAPDADASGDFRNVYNASAVFGPEGAVLGVQRKVHLIDLEGPGGLDLSAGRIEDIEPIPTSLGKLGVMICLDAFLCEIVDRLEEADILVQPSANPGPWEPWQQEEWLQSSWRAVVEDGAFTYGVNPMLTGDILDLSFYGQSTILAADDGLAPARAAYHDIDPIPGFLRVSDREAEKDILAVRVPHPGEMDD